MTFRVVVSDQVPVNGLVALLDDDRFELVEVTDEDEMRSALPSAAALVIRSATTVDEELLEAGPKLVVVARAGVGVDNIDLAAASRRGVAVFNAPGANTLAAAELTVALILAAARRVVEADRAVHQGRWERAAFRGFELSGKTLGLIGAGRIGAEVAVRCRAFGMEVVAYDPGLDEGRARELGIESVDLDRAVTGSDVVSLHVPLNDETKGLIGADLIGRMRRDAILVNISRGGVVDEAALVSALKEGRIGGAALDVFAEEPLPADSPLRTAPRLVLTPHLGASTVEAQHRVAEEAATAVFAVLIEGDHSGAVNLGELGDH